MHTIIASDLINKEGRGKRGEISSYKYKDKIQLAHWTSLVLTCQPSPIQKSH